MLRVGLAQEKLDKIRQKLLQKSGGMDILVKNAVFADKPYVLNALSAIALTENLMPKYLTIHEETDMDRILLESRWTEISMDPRADWQITLFNMKLGKRYCEWDAPHAQVLKEIFRDLRISWSEILEVEVESATAWRLWEIEAAKRKPNCWEVMNCGKEPGGANVDDKGICPAAVNRPYYGRNRGMFAGRYCWKVVGTYCGGEVQGSFARKMRDCAMCDFFQQVKREEGESFEP